MKWRKIKKWFKKNKGKYIGMCVAAQQKDGRYYTAEIDDVRIYPEHGTRFEMQFDTTPLKVEVQQEVQTNQNGFSASLEMTIETPTMELKKLLK